MSTKTGRAFDVLKKSAKIFSENDPLRLAGATAFFTTFALPAVLFLILQVLRLFLSQQESSEQLFGRLSLFVGRDASRHLFMVLNNFEKIAKDPLAVIGGFIFLLFVATTLFKVIKNSLNDLWDIRVKNRISLKVILTTRSRELGIILSAGILLLVTLLIEGIHVAARQKFGGGNGFPGSFAGDVFSFIIAVAVVTCWFGIIFCYLPDARIPLQIGFAGALLTSLLFNIGKVILRHLLFDSNLNQVFGASAAVVLLLLFVFYSSMMFFFGAAFTKALANHRNIEVKPLSYADHYVIKASKFD